MAGDSLLFLDANNVTAPNKSTGKTAADPLPSIANTNAARLSQYQERSRMG